MGALEQTPPVVPVAVACRALGASRATPYRRTMPPLPPTPREPRRVPRRLGDEERARVLAVLDSPAHVDQPRCSTRPPTSTSRRPRSTARS